jgi:hypothetical protein
MSKYLTACTTLHLSNSSDNVADKQDPNSTLASSLSASKVAPLKSSPTTSSPSSHFFVVYLLQPTIRQHPSHQTAMNNNTKDSSAACRHTQDSVTATSLVSLSRFSDLGNYKGYSQAQHIVRLLSMRRAQKTPVETQRPPREEVGLYVGTRRISTRKFRREMFGVALFLK